jgi:hypothetical protein
MIRKTLLALSLAAVAAPASAHRHGVDMCDIQSPYSLTLNEGALSFTRDSGSPQRIEMHRGHLLVDGRELALSAADRERIAHYEAQVRALVPQVKAIAKEAVGIAFAAITQVAKTFADSDADFRRTGDRLELARHELERRIDSELDGQPWHDAAFERAIEDTIKATVPVLVGDITAKALKVAFSGDEKAANELERRAGELEKTLEREVERRADALEARAKALCPQVAELDRIEAELVLRLEGNQPLDIVRKR